jgi:hypothetical protein
MEQAFYLILDSNMAAESKLNTPGNFEVSLPTRHDLSEGYEVACTDISYPVSWFNVPEDTTFQVTEANERDHELTVHAGFYSSPQQLVDEINLQISKITINSVIPVRLEYDVIANRIRSFPSQGIDGVEVSDDSPVITFHEPLSSLLGTVGSNETNADGCDMTRNIDSLFIHCDIVAPTPVSSQLKNVVQIAFIPSTLAAGQMIREKFFPRKYVQLAVTEFHRIRITIKDGASRPIDFKSGVVTVCLHFRRRLGYL